MTSFATEISTAFTKFTAVDGLPQQDAASITNFIDYAKLHHDCSACSACPIYIDSVYLYLKYTAQNGVTVQQARAITTFIEYILTVHESFPCTLLTNASSVNSVQPVLVNTDLSDTCHVDLTREDPKVRTEYIPPTKSNRGRPKSATYTMVGTYSISSGPRSGQTVDAFIKGTYTADLALPETNQFYFKSPKGDMVKALAKNVTITFQL